MEEYERQQYLSKDYNNVTGANATRASTMNVDEVIEFLKSVTPDNCKNFWPDDLVLRGDIGFGMDKQFENEARMALRLANFLSAFLQVKFFQGFTQDYILSLKIFVLKHIASVQVTCIPLYTFAPFLICNS